jgi:MoaA/NifB/PqqE/SkfB family radical SAM enzyme
MHSRDSVAVPVQTYFTVFQAVLGIYLTNKCNIECRHCCVSSGPRESSHLSLTEILPQVAELVGNGTVRALHVSGGEPFLYRDDVHEIAEVGAQANIPVAINTNGFWATDISRARRLLKGMPGISQIILSADEYHLDYLPLERVVNATAACLELGVLVHISVCTPEGKRTDFVDHLEHALGREVLSNVSLSVSPVELGGRADTLVEAQWRTLKAELPEGRCRLLNRPVILEDGTVHACCNTTVAKRCRDSPLNLGNVRNEPLSSILQRSQGDAVLHAIRIYGPKFLAERFASAASLSGTYREGDICSLCADMMANESVVDQLVRGSEDNGFRATVRAGRALLLGEGV